MPMAEKAMKERDRTQMPVAKKERTDHKCMWQRKKDQTTNAGGQTKNGCPNQASKQLTPNERNETAGQPLGGGDSSVVRAPDS